MRVLRYATVAGLMLAYAPFVGLCAQNPSVNTGSEGHFWVFNHATKVPYTATVKVTTVQKLEDGVTITHQSITKMARDSNNRRYFETHQTLGAGDDQTPDQYSAVIQDIANRTVVQLTSHTQEAVISHFPAPTEVSHSPAPSQPMTRTSQVAAVTAPMIRPKFHVEEHLDDLGTRTIAGVAAYGKRTTRLIPIGFEGNDQPLTETEEIWSSPDVPFALLEIHDDPATGMRTSEVTYLELTEPDPVVFQIPAGYRVTDRNPRPPN